MNIPGQEFSSWMKLPDPVDRTKADPGNMALPLTWVSDNIFGKDKKSNGVVPPSQANASQAAIPQPTLFSLPQQ